LDIQNGWQQPFKKNKSCVLIWNDEKCKKTRWASGTLVLLLSSRWIKGLSVQLWWSCTCVPKKWRTLYKCSSCRVWQVGRYQCSQ
jgi:hypothetical protein